MKTALITLDYVVDIMCEGGKVARCAAQAVERQIIANANRAIAVARSQGWLVIHVRVGFSEHYQEQPTFSRFFGRAHELGALNLADRGCDFHPELDVQPEDAIVTKHRVSAFYATSLEAILRANKIDRLLIAGVSSSWAVHSAVRDAHDRDYEVVVVEDACAAASEEEHLAAMRLLANIAHVTTSHAVGEL